MSTWELITYDLIDGEVNDMRATGFVIEIDDADDDASVAAALMDAGIVSPMTATGLDLDGDENQILVSLFDEPVCELRPAPDCEPSGRIQ